MRNEGDHAFITDVLNASLTVMSILVAVITFLAVEYKGARRYAPMAASIRGAVWGTTAASVLAGVIAFGALIQLRSGRGSIAWLTWAFGVLIAAMTLGIVGFVYALMA